MSPALTWYPPVHLHTRSQAYFWRQSLLKPGAGKDDFKVLTPVPARRVLSSTQHHCAWFMPHHGQAEQSLYQRSLSPGQHPCLSALLHGFVPFQPRSLTGKHHKEVIMDVYLHG